MALIDPPAFLGLEGNTYPAARLRRVHQLLLGGREGVLAPDAMVVTQTGTPSLSVSVSAGAAVVNGDDVARQGCYVVESTGAVTVGPVSTPHGSLARIDRLVLEVLDQEGTGSGGGGRGSDLPRYRIVAGTPSADPTPPAEPDTAITLALITVGPSASAILDASIADVRPSARMLPPVETSDLANDAVTAEKILDGAIMQAKIGALQVGAGQIGTSAVATSKIANGAVTPEKVSGWTGLTPATSMGAGWSSGGMDHHVVRARRDMFGRVFLRGAAIKSSGTSNTVCTLPTGFRPSALESFACAGLPFVNQMVTVMVEPNGVVSVSGSSIQDGHGVSLSGIQFEAG